jgi:hypothetical protein
MLKKLTKQPATKIVASIPDSNYMVSKDGRIFRELKPTVIQERHYYNVVLDGVLRRVSKKELIEVASNV